MGGSGKAVTAPISLDEYNKLVEECIRLHALLAVARKECGQANCNCPGAPRVKAAIAVVDKAGAP
jgi:hypothetical protein